MTDKAAVLLTVPKVGGLVQPHRVKVEVDSAAFLNPSEKRKSF